jgi:hypothetical protein
MTRATIRDAKRRRTIETDAGGLVMVRSVNRRVRLTVVMRRLKTYGHGPDSFTEVVGPDVLASAHLDEAAVDRLIKRLQNVRGGKAAHKNKPRAKKVVSTSAREPAVVNVAREPHCFDEERG